MASRVRTARAPARGARAVEEQLVHPLARMSGRGNGDVVASRLAEEREAKETLQDLERMGPDAPGFDTVFAQFRGKVLAHARYEEVDEFPRLRVSVPAAQLQALVLMVKAVEAALRTPNLLRGSVGGASR